MTIEVVKPGLSTTVQDLGRPGWYHLGIPMSGAMDRQAMRAANLLVGNDEGAATLEMTFLGPELRFTAPALVAALIGQLGEGGRLIAPVGGAAAQSLVELRKAADGSIEETVLAPVSFVPLLSGVLD